MLYQIPFSPLRFDPDNSFSTCIWGAPTLLVLAPATRVYGSYALLVYDWTSTIDSL